MNLPEPVYYGSSMLYHNFYNKHLKEVEESVEYYYKGREAIFSDHFQYLYLLLGQSKKHVEERIKNRAIRRRQNCLSIELNFVKYVLDSLDRLGAKNILYWDLDDTLLSYSKVRPSAPFILRFLNEQNFELGVFSNNSVAVSKIYNDVGEFKSITKYFAKERIHMNPPPLIRVNLGDIPIQDFEEEKIKKFLGRFKTGILIDNSIHTISLERINRGICVYHVQPKF